MFYRSAECFLTFVWLNGALEDGQQTSGGTPPLAAEVQPGGFGTVGSGRLGRLSGSSFNSVMKQLQGPSDKPCDEHLVALLNVLNTLLP